MSTMPDGVVLCFDRPYAWPACVAAQSVIATWADPRPLTIYCLCDPSVGPDEVDALRALGAKESVDLRLISRPFDFPDLRIDYITPMGYGRVVAPELIDAERLLYLDCDMLACTSVSSLLRPVGGGFPVAAARDPYIPELTTPHVESTRFPLGDRDGEFPYFNSGLLLMDVPTWRAERITERARDLMDNPTWRPLFGDQDTLNHIVSGRFELLDQRWNVMPVSAIQSVLSEFTFYGERYLPLSYQQNLEQYPWILHYATDVKPWTDRFPDGQLRRRWRSVADKAAAVIRASGAEPPTAAPSAPTMRWSAPG
jgi:lipopolysaccharide biosynthesis glycosyltransferase